MDSVTNIQSTDAISLKLLYVRNQLNTNKHGKCEKNRLINVVAMTTCSMRVSDTWRTPRR